MATLDQLYRAYLNEDPNVSQMNYDPFGWNYEQTFDTTEEDTGTDTGIRAVAPTTGGNNYGPFNPDPSKVRMPTGSPYRTDIYGMDEFSNPALLDPKSPDYAPHMYQSRAEMIHQQNRADAGAYAYDSPQYIGGAAGNITQTGPGRQFDYNPLISAGGAKIDPISARDLMGIEEDASWFKRLREGAMDNPLMQGIMTAVNPAMLVGKNILKGISQVLPVNERAIIEKQASQQGVALDDIGRVVRQETGWTDGEWGTIDYTDPRNIWTGYNYANLTDESFRKRRKKIENTKYRQPGTKQKYLDAIDKSYEFWKLQKADARAIVDEKTREKGLTPMSDQIAMNKAKQEMQQKIKDEEKKDDKPKAPPSKPKVTTPFHPSQGGQNQGAGGGQTAAPGGTGKGSSYSRGNYGGRGHHWAKGGLVNLYKYGGFLG